jgi:hypothetical protein
LFHQTRQLSFTEPDTACLALLGAHAAGPDGEEPRPGLFGLPPFLSPAPPRSEGEALLRRIFSRAERM